MKVILAIIFHEFFFAYFKILLLKLFIRIIFDFFWHLN